ncbi:hypothetical protein HZH68_015278 [Vespula germanica]|uniref:Uncharacterized protein n=1 Tax=Vespula germanica TaxID=30212 RepID=A0A834J5T9_VESGE|nr:hypothetical protein HZH68_015278 [Vespula germanica]
MIIPEMRQLEEKESYVIAYPNRIEFALNYSIKIGRGILRVIGAWPVHKKSSNIEKIYSYFAKNTRVRLKIIGPLCSCLINAMKYTILMTRGKKIQECMKYVREDWKKVVLEKDYESMMSHAKVGRTLAVMSASFLYGAGMSYRTILPLSKGKLMIAYELVFFGQFLAGFVVYSVACGVCGLATFLIMHACGQLEILMRMMRNIVDGKDDTDDTDPDTRIAEVIRHQIRSKK